MEIGWEENKPGDQEIGPGTSESSHWVVAKGRKRRKILEELEFPDLNAASEMGKEWALRVPWRRKMAWRQNARRGIDLVGNSSCLGQLQFDVLSTS